METPHIPVLNWIATMRDRATGKNHRFPVEGVDHLEASGKAKAKAEQHCAWIIAVEILE